MMIKRIIASNHCSAKVMGASVAKNMTYREFLIQDIIDSVVQAGLSEDDIMTLIFKLADVMDGVDTDD